jgi:hypothetical protein
MSKTGSRMMATYNGYVLELLNKMGTVAELGHKHIEKSVGMVQESGRRKFTKGAKPCADGQLVSEYRVEYYFNVQTPFIIS